MEKNSIWLSQAKKGSDLKPGSHIVSKFEKMCISKFITHRKLSCIFLVDCLLKVFSIM